MPDSGLSHSLRARLCDVPGPDVTYIKMTPESPSIDPGHVWFLIYVSPSCWVLLSFHSIHFIESHALDVSFIVLDVLLS